MSQRTVLIVEDATEFQFLLRLFFEGEGYRVLAATNGEEALQILRSSSPTLPSFILLDLVMPIMDGYEFREIQRKDEKISHIPVVVMTANGRNRSDQEKLLVKDFLNKPLEIQQLQDLVAKYQ